MNLPDNNYNSNSCSSQEEFCAYNTIPSAYDPAVIEQKEKNKQNKKGINSVGLLLLISSFVFTIAAVVFSLIYQLCQGTYIFPSEFDSIPDNIFNGLINSASFGFCAVIFLKLTKTEFSEVLVFEKIKAGKLLGLVAIGFAVSMLSNMLTNLFLTNTYCFGINLIFDIESPISNTAPEIIVYLLSTAVIPAFSEEILFRGAILGKLRKYGDGFAVFVSALLFGLFHGNFIQIPFAFIVGLVLGLTVVYTNSMLPAILIHFANNAFSVIFDILETNAETWGLESALIDISYYLIVAVSSFIAIVAVALISKKEKNFMKLNPATTDIDNKTRNKFLVTSPTIIIATVILLIESVMIYF
ncbi:MAG: CPBP family intramembrane metalloprotease [Ruminococcus sp.]|nr:CPBP family intramembrane metalloprotease [Ruminococcus sp.]